LTTHRTGRMGDIVATIQAEQDAIIRQPLQGVLVVQGVPGTGKTAVALHRAAYLLYRHRERIAKSGVLLVGPSPVFLKYIEKVLPSLGETGALLLTPGQLYPGLDTEISDDPVVAEIKGRSAMARVLAHHIANYERVPEHDERLRVGAHTVLLRRK
ncbi:DNA helicase, partial [Burkholderia multivorans]